jgi:hypothetical protein
VALLPEPTLRPEVAARSLAARPLFGCRLVRPLGILHRRRPGLSPGARGFLELLCGQGNESPPAANGAAAHRGRHDNGRSRPPRPAHAGEAATTND